MSKQKTIQHLTTDQLAHEIRTFTNKDKPKRKFSFWKVIRRLGYFLALIIEFLDRTGIGQAQVTRKF